MKNAFQKKINKELVYKILIVGKAGVGKSSIIMKYVFDNYSSLEYSTIGMDFFTKTIEWNNNLTINVQLWDIAGQERFAHLTRSYYRGAIGAFVVLDATNENSFDIVEKWKANIDLNVKFPNCDVPIPVVLLVNKYDLVNETFTLKQWDEIKQKIDKFSKDKGFVDWFETSAITGGGIDEAVHTLVSSILDKTIENPDNITNFESIIIDTNSINKTNYCC